jgi:hypothetical protein
MAKEDIIKQQMAILAWFRHECNTKFTDLESKIRLADTWIEICKEREEYELAHILNEEKKNLLSE